VIEQLEQGADLAVDPGRFVRPLGGVDRGIVRLVVDRSMGASITEVPARWLCSCSHEIRFFSVELFFLITKIAGSRRLSSGTPTPDASVLLKSMIELVKVTGRRDLSNRPTPMKRWAGSSRLESSLALSLPTKPSSIRICVWLRRLL